jgi:hypothetical protein
MWYVITEERGKLEALFFPSQERSTCLREKAEEWAEENYYLCTGDVREVVLHE